MKEKKVQGGKRSIRALTIMAYALLIVGLLIIAPVVCPPVFGYHTYTVSEDYSGNMKPFGTLVYVEALSGYNTGNIVAVGNPDGGRDVDVYYVGSVQGGKITLEEGDTVDVDQVAGRVVAKTPFFGYLSRLCFSTGGIILTAALFAVGIGLAAYGNIRTSALRKESLDRPESGSDRA